MAIPANLPAAARPRFQNPARPTFAPLFRGDAVAVYDWQCPGCDAPEEYNDAYEVVVVRRGAFVREVDGSPAFITAGTLMFASAGEVHRIRHPVPGGDACSVFRGSVATLRDMLGTDAPRFPVRQAPIGGREYLLHRLAMRAASAGAGADPVEQEESALWFLQAAVAFVSRRDGGTAGPRDRKAMERAVGAEEVIRDRYQGRLTLAEIGRAVGCSPFQLSRVVRAVTGLSIHRILMRYRLRHALELVLDSQAGLSEVAYATGFSSHSHLSDAFRREFGCSPSRVRRGPRVTLRAAKGAIAAWPLHRVSASRPPLSAAPGTAG
ncbi:MAG TPA: AraC family transcriptional regulator [Gemmatimonadales bacterium]|nr:AraC family transcriptional regulator [Gemmatimonadales bacterium]